MVGSAVGFGVAVGAVAPASRFNTTALIINLASFGFSAAKIFIFANFFVKSNVNVFVVSPDANGLDPGHTIPSSPFDVAYRIAAPKSASVA